MSLDKAIRSGREWRDPRRPVSRRCEHHGGCHWCEGNRTHSGRVAEFAAEDEIREWVDGTAERFEDELALVLRWQNDRPLTLLERMCEEVESDRDYQDWMVNPPDDWPEWSHDFDEQRHRDIYDPYDPGCYSDDWLVERDRRAQEVKARWLAGEEIP